MSKYVSTDDGSYTNLRSTVRARWLGVPIVS